MIRTYLLNKNELDNIVYSEEIFSDDRKEKIARLKREEDRQLSACAELLLIYALRMQQEAKILPLTLEKDEREKLRLKDSSCCFNLSHTKDYAACAVSDAPVGVDIESFKVRDVLYPNRILHPDEAQLYAYISNPNEKKKYFYECWVAKESYLKNLGIGLIVRPSDFLVSEDRLKIRDQDMTAQKGHHKSILPLSEREKDPTLSDNLMYLEKRYVHVYEPGEVRGTDWKFDAGYKLAVCSMEKDPDHQARLIHAADVNGVLSAIKESMV